MTTQAVTQLPDVLIPQWSVSARVRAAFSLRAGGVSEGAYDSLNMGVHVGDELWRVKENRQRLSAALGLSAEPLWLNQVHGTTVWHARRSPGVAGLGFGTAGETPMPEADAVVTADEGVVLAIQVADCLPVLLASDHGQMIGAAHAGWRGLVSGVLEATVGAMRASDAAMRASDAAMRASDARLMPESIQAWLGPCIGPQQFEVGDEVREAFLAAGDPAEAFVANPQGRWQADLLYLARRRLQALGITQISGGHWCTASDPHRFFSHRRESREGRPSGRMTALLWLEPTLSQKTAHMGVEC